MDSMEDWQRIGESKDAFSPPIRLLIAIPTFNRLQIVDETVACLRKLDGGSTIGWLNWSVLVVDNASNDATFEALRSKYADWPRFSVVCEQIRGSSRARNRALDECSHDYIHFLDDECLVEDDFLERLGRLLKERMPLMYGGPVLPRYRQAMPRWYFEALGCMSVPALCGGSDRVSISGPNMGFRVSNLVSLGGFDEELGIHGGKLGYGEETDIELKFIARHGYEQLAFDRGLVAHHLTLPEKFRIKRLMMSNFLRGRARAELASREWYAAALLRRPTPEFRPDEQLKFPLPERSLLLLLGAVRRLGFLFQRLQNFVVRSAQE
jgi:glycosyltransferase involved in cell wall biosynthesis